MKNLSGKFHEKFFFILTIAIAIGALLPTALSLPIQEERSCQNIAHFKCLHFPLSCTT